MATKSTQESDENLYDDGHECQSSKEIVKKRKSNNNSITLYKGNWPPQFTKLNINTNLNQYPPNWSRCQFIYDYFRHPLQKDYFSFQLASEYIDYIGKVDVVTMSPNIKNLLKMAYTSKSHLSLVIHRVGNTLLIDEFDIAALLFEFHPQHERFKQFITAVLKALTPGANDVLVRPNKSRDVVQSRNLLSKFLHYSVDGPATREANEIEQIGKPTVEPSSSKMSEERLPKDDTVHPTPLQNIIWNFENLCMLIGSDLPIFGGYDSPCISLRLSDADKPINILTGIDYWLDNMMTNVPEVVMCHHVRGIVQHYQRIRTEDLPNLPDSKFSPVAVVEMAQNVLNFLNQKATKEGHTYWLFKGKDDDIVKLYDLTSISENLQDESSESSKDSEIGPQDNPFSGPVAMLLYKVAYNMSRTQEAATNHANMSALLKGSLKLLNNKKHAQVYCAANYLLSDTLIPYGINPESPKLSDVSDSEEGLPEKIQSDKQTSKKKKKKKAQKEVSRHEILLQQLRSPNVKLPVHSGREYEAREPLSKDIKERCQEALNCVIESIKCIKERLKTNPTSGSEEEEPKQADSSQAIPMPYHSSSDKDKQVALSHSEFLVVVGSENFIASSWEQKLLLMHLQKAILINHIWATLAVNDHKYGVALFHLKLALMCWKAVAKYRGKDVQDSLAICYRIGDCYKDLSVLSRDKIKTHSQEYKKVANLHKKAEAEIASLIEEDEIPKCLIPPTTEECLDRSLEYFRTKGYDINNNSLLKNIAGVLNEKATIKSASGEELIKIANKRKKGKKLIEESTDLLKECLLIFIKLDDHVNSAVVSINLGRNFRILYHYGVEKSDSFIVSTEELGYLQEALASFHLGFDNVTDPIWKDRLLNQLIPTGILYSQVLYENKCQDMSIEKALTTASRKLNVIISMMTSYVRDKKYVHEYANANLLASKIFLNPEYKSSTLAPLMVLTAARSYFTTFCNHGASSNETSDIIKEKLYHVHLAEQMLKRSFPNKDTSFTELYWERIRNFKVLQSIPFSYFSVGIFVDHTEHLTSFLKNLQQCMLGILALVKANHMTNKVNGDLLRETYLLSLKPTKPGDLLKVLRDLMEKAQKAFNPPKK